MVDQAMAGTNVFGYWAQGKLHYMLVVLRNSKDF
jgi:hypothetical protein